MELFIKRFIDLLDEEVPVSMVHTVIEQSLGAIMNDSYLVIHARRDLVDEDSPFLEIEIYPLSYQKVRLLFAFTFPKNCIQIDQNEFELKLKETNMRVDKVKSLQNESELYYELFAENEWDIPVNRAEIDQVIVEIVEFINEWMSSSGYESNDA